jgi:hypothetical protein
MMVLLRAIACTAAGVWLGAIVVIAIVAQTTFSVMPTTGVAHPNTVAGQVMARNFSRFDMVQLACGAVLAVWQLVELAAGRRSRRDLVRAVLIIAACVLMLVSVFVMTPKITGMQSLLSSPDSESAVKAAFAEFHGTAVRISQLTMMLVLAIALEMAWPRPPRRV